MIYKLPTRSPRKYRGKYPTRINSWSYSSSPSQVIVAEHLGMKRPVHFELNDGDRYIADMRDLRGDNLRLSAELFDILNPDVLMVESNWADLSRERYDAMVADIQAHREAAR